MSGSLAFGPGLVDSPPVAVLDFEKPLVELEEHIAKLRTASSSSGDTQQSIAALEREARELRASLYRSLSTWQKVQLSRHPERPYVLDYIERCFDDFVELHGDRLFSDDPSIVAGLATFDGVGVAVIGHQKGRSTKEKLKRNFGMSHPEGYRKAMRVMRLAERFGRPVITLIDTPGAYPGIGAEERGQSEAIGASILTMAELKVPTVAIVIGEGGSGGALALGVADTVMMLRYATYSVITPEGCASILWRDGAQAPQAAEALKLLADDALRLGIVDKILEEPEGGAHRDAPGAAQSLARGVREALRVSMRMSEAERLEQRYNKFRNIGFVRGEGAHGQPRTEPRAGPVAEPVAEPRVNGARSKSDVPPPGSPSQDASPARRSSSSRAPSAAPAEVNSEAKASDAGAVAPGAPQVTAAANASSTRQHSAREAVQGAQSNGHAGTTLANGLTH